MPAINIFFKLMFIFYYYCYYYTYFANNFALEYNVFLLNYYKLCRSHTAKQFFSPFIIVFLRFINEECTHCCINIIINFVKIEM